MCNSDRFWRFSFGFKIVTLYLHCIVCVLEQTGWWYWYQWRWHKFGSAVPDRGKSAHIMGEIAMFGLWCYHCVVYTVTFDCFSFTLCLDMCADMKLNACHNCPIFPILFWWSCNCFNWLLSYSQIQWPSSITHVLTLKTVNM